MERKPSSYLDSWDDQWKGSNPDPAPSVTAATAEKSSIDSTTADDKNKFGEGLGKVKVMASNGMKKVKESTSLGLQWIKDKYHEISEKN
ncbi:hypothetical protein I3760_12G021500 [Carya illinoinensis]|uniref:Uncharacterized protein n=1 Tax=Carya illinoinensis TaxID=32201 RepID=A0A922DFR3_CARIL|nr:hypothetical protein I3760_12G021500 [Carya illinoinensis]KAG6683579.1 hypothetical protein I3842_12G021200 [Carya illinoinensis]